MAVGLRFKRAHEADFWLVFFNIPNSCSNKVIISEVCHAKVSPASGTQAKWNRRDGSILSSSHSKGILIWDRWVGFINNPP